MRLALRGDLPKLVERLLPLGEALLKLAANRELPEAHRDAAYAQATRDVAAAVYAWMHEVARAPDEDGELCRLIDWLLGVWRAFATQLPLERLAHDALGNSEASALWEAMRERCYRWRFLNESRDRLERCEAVERLLPQFERGVLRSRWVAVPGAQSNSPVVSQPAR